MSRKKVICINDLISSYLTANKKYQVIEEDKENYKVKNDKGNEWWYDKTIFKQSKI